MFALSFVCVIFSLILSETFCLDFWKLRLVDSNATTNNFLVRGPYPGGSILKKSFIQYYDWKEYMRVLIKEETGIWVDEIYIIDISFLHGYGEDLERIEVEKEYFSKNPSHGEYVHWEMNGTHLNATTLSKSERDSRLSDMETWDVDKIITRESYVHNIIHSFSGKKVATIVYWHCEGGVDRTGEMSGGYYMKYFNWTFKKSFDYDVKVKEGKPIGEGNSKLMNWYCFWLEKYEKKENLQCETW